MNSLVYIISRFASILLSVLELCMFIRALLSWVMPDADNTVVELIYSVTEPLIFPVRALLEKIPAVRNMPIDISFTVTYLLLVIIQLMI